MDKHFQIAPLAQNAPALLALAHVFNRNGLGRPVRAVVPYAQRLHLLPTFLQQLEMESNGKSIGLDGARVTHGTAPVVFGDAGTNGQHAFFQLLHQGTSVIPVEFMIAREGFEPELRYQHELLMSNCLAQGQALLKGRTVAEAFHEIYFLERACQAQVQALAGGSALRIPPAQVCELTASQFNREESAEIMGMAWRAALRLIEDPNSDYRS